MIQVKNIRADVQELRGLAVLAVVINHLGNDWLPGGYLGVDVFFVISGYVITRSVILGNSVSTSKSRFFIEFWLRRVYRLWPMLFTTVVLTCLLLAITDTGLPGPVFTGLSSLFAVSNFRLLIGRLEYFSIDTSSDWFMHTWSLAVEEQIYLLLSVSLAFLYGKSMLERSESKRLSSAAAVALLTLISFSFALSPLTTELLRFYSPHTRFYQVGIGSLIALWPLEHERVRERRWRSQTASVSLAACLGLLGLFASDPASGRIGSLLATLGTAAVMTASTPIQRRSGLLKSTLLSRLGDRSYSVYLVHWPIQLAWTEVTANRFLAGCGSLLSTLVLGSFGYRVVELRTRDVWRSLGIKVATLVSAVIFLVTVSVTIIMFVVVERSTRPPVLARSDRTCTNDSAQVWVVGDSHFTLSPQQSLVAELLDGNCRFIGGYGIILDFQDLAKDSLGQRSVRIKLMSPDLVIRQIVETPSPPKLLLIVHFLTAFLSDPITAPASADFVAVEWEDASGNPVTRRQFITLFEQNLIKYSTVLAKRGASLIVTSPPPDFDWIRYPVENNQCGNPAGRLCTKYRTEATITKSQHEARGGELRRLLDSLAMTIPNFTHLQLDAPFCNLSHCSNFANGGPLYMDDDHLNMAGVRMLAPLYAKVLRTALNLEREATG